MPEDLPALVRRARHATKLPLAVGFGISLPGHVSILGGLADAAVVGSALVEEIERAATPAAAADGVASRHPFAEGSRRQRSEPSRGAQVKNIEDWRRRIDEIDRQLVELLNERSQCAAEIGHIKQQANLPLYQPEREKEVLQECRGI